MVGVIELVGLLGLYRYSNLVLMCVVVVIIVCMLCVLFVCSGICIIGVLCVVVRLLSVLKVGLVIISLVLVFVYSMVVWFSGLLEFGNSCICFLFRFFCVVNRLCSLLVIVNRYCLFWFVMLWVVVSVVGVGL